VYRLVRECGFNLSLDVLAGVIDYSPNAKRSRSKVVPEFTEKTNGII